jgi:hypothetical protein
MGLTEDANAVLEAGRLGPAEPPVAGRSPQPVAFARHATYGAVMFLTVTRGGDTICIVPVMERGADAWEDLTVVQKPWWGPEEAFAKDELLATGGHSRFASGRDFEIVVIPGQAAPDTTVARVDSGQPEAVVVHGPWGHFVYVGSTSRDGDPVTLVAEREGIRQTEVFERLDAP